MGRHPTLHNDSFASIGCLKDGTQAIGLSLQCIPFANNRGHFGQYLRQVRIWEFRTDRWHPTRLKWAHRESATQPASLGSAFLAAVKGAAGNDTGEVRHNLTQIIGSAAS